MGTRVEKESSLPEPDRSLSPARVSPSLVTPFLDEDVIRTLLSIPLWEIAELDQPSRKGDKKILGESLPNCLVYAITVVALEGLNSGRMMSDYKVEKFSVDFHGPKDKFPIRLENPHVISANQIWAGVVPAGPSGYSFNSSYRSHDSIEYKLELDI
ncbi:unnamed protein product [Camellia sinensis]